MEPAGKPAVFFDRDGTLNQDLHFVHKSEDFVWIDGAMGAISYANRKGYLVLVVTNQSGIARGYFDETTVDSLHSWMNEELKTIDAKIDDFAYCPHHPEATIKKYRKVCSCRKPESGMIEYLIAKWGIDVSKSILIGDADRDIEAAEKAGVTGCKFQGGSLLEFLKVSLGDLDT